MIIQGSCLSPKLNTKMLEVVNTIACPSLPAYTEFVIGHSQAIITKQATTGSINPNGYIVGTK